ncbi:MAG: GerMN domain-containing protein [Desulfobacteraceae bacterium]|nr:GerMN domain-containing protein [Desulfobacteraceae bacterium]
MKFSKKTAFISILSIIMIFGAVVFFLNTDKDSKQKKSYKIEIPEKQAEGKEVFLYFANLDNSALEAEKQKIIFNSDTRKFAQSIIEALLKGPANKSLMSALPEGTKLLSLYIQDNLIAVLDFSEEIRENHPGGSQAEILTIYSIVNTLTLNIEEIKEVKILINGNEAETLAGHIALSFPLKENLTIVK